MREKREGEEPVFYRHSWGGNSGHVELREKQTSEKIQRMESECIGIAYNERTEDETGKANDEKWIHVWTRPESVQTFSCFYVFEKIW